jgi:hypothetical protein
VLRRALGDLPEDVTVRKQLRGPLDLIVCFVTARRDLEAAPAAAARGARARGDAVDRVAEARIGVATT